MMSGAAQTSNGHPQGNQTQNMHMDHMCFEGPTLPSLSGVSSLNLGTMRPPVHENNQEVPEISWKKTYLETQTKPTAMY